MTAQGHPTLAELTTLRVGGPARDVVTARTRTDLVEAVTTADHQGVPLLLIGGGSNLLVADAGFSGTLVRIGTRGISPEFAEPGWVSVRVEAGEPWERVVATAVEQGWSGVEALSGIPGSTGATPIQNVGAYGAEVAQVIESLEVLDRPTGAVTSMAPDEAGFGYRTSMFKRRPGRWVVLSVTLRLPNDPLSAPVRYAELAAMLGIAVGERAPAAAVRQAVLELRRGKGMVLDPHDHDTWSAGSFFTNPIISTEQATHAARGGSAIRPAGRLGQDLCRVADLPGGLRAWLRGASRCPRGTVRQACPGPDQPWRSQRGRGARPGPDGAGRRR